jgi:hypothetical protein
MTETSDVALLMTRGAGAWFPRKLLVKALGTKEHKTAIANVAIEFHKKLTNEPL